MNPPRNICRLLWLVTLLSGTTLKAAPLEFNRDIRPILAEKCFQCHGQDAKKRKGGLRLDVQEFAFGKAESGDLAIVPGHPELSEVITRIFSTDKDELMPPPKAHRSISPEEKSNLKRWISEGAKYQAHWSFIAPVKVTLPQVKNPKWIRNPIDQFVLAKLEASGLAPSPEADRPATPGEVDAFVTDGAADAYERVVDRLLASPQFGERMAMPWLDAARYADSNGFQQDGDTYQWMWRDWVVKSLNADMPFDRFSIEQLAGDLLPEPTKDQLIATAFNRNHLLNGEGGAIAEATNWLGLTMACAQCHDHKYDPITQRDYYGLLDIFNRVSENGSAPIISGPKRIATPFLEVAPEEVEKRMRALEDGATKLEAEAINKDTLIKEFTQWLPTVTAETKRPNQQLFPANLLTILKISQGERTDAQSLELENGLRPLFEKEIWSGVGRRDLAVKNLALAKKEIARIKKEEFARVMIMRDDKVRPTFVLDRGNYEKPLEKVEFTTPAFLPKGANGAPKNRLGFAEWLFTPDHPLTARVQINRIWQIFFGVGLVRTAEDFGVQSEMPLHRELLDWLAVEFRERHWRMKEMNRLIVTSAAYRQSSRVTSQLLERDPENRLLARGARFRAPSMILRDIALSASGLLDQRLGGKPVYPYQPEAIWETLAITKERDFNYPLSSGADLYRRSLYTFWRRTIGPANMFDASSRQTCKVRLSATSTPLHALTTLNDPTWGEAARVLAARCLQAGGDANAQLTLAFRRVVGRHPTPKDLALLRRALEKQRAIYLNDPKRASEVVTIGNAPTHPELPAIEHAALTAVCLAILNLDEALTRE